MLLYILLGLCVMSANAGFDEQPRSSQNLLIERLLGALLKERDTQDLSVRASYAQNKLAIQNYNECSDLSQFDPRVVAWWQGRTAINVNEEKPDWDLHNIKSDGTGVLNMVSGTSITGKTPARMWCRQQNPYDKEIKIQYGPTDLGMLICIDLQIPNDKPNRLLVKVNPALFTNPLNLVTDPDQYSCLRYREKSTMDGYTVISDRLEDPASDTYTRIEAPAASNDFPILTDKKLLDSLKAGVNKITEFIQDKTG